MKLAALVFVVGLVGCGAASEVDPAPPSPQQQTACTPRRYPWLTRGAGWAFEITEVTGRGRGTRRITVTLGTAKQTGDFTLYPVMWDEPLLSVPSDQGLFWSQIGTSKCGDIVVSDGETVYTVYSATTDAWTGMGFFHQFDESAMVYVGAEMIPSMYSEMQSHDTVTAIGNVAGNADGCSFYSHFGTYCTDGDWKSVDLEFEYWDTDTGPAGYHRSANGLEYRIERGNRDVLPVHREPDSATKPWHTTRFTTGELGPMDLQDWVAFPANTGTPVLEWEGDATLELSLVTRDAYQDVYAITRKDTGKNRVVWTLTATADIPR